MRTPMNEGGAGPQDMMSCMIHPWKLFPRRRG